MTPQTIEQLFQFLGRVPLNGSEAEPFVACIEALRREHARLTATAPEPRPENVG